LPEALRLADLLAALSLTTDLAMGQPPEKAIRASVVATALARKLSAPESEVADVYYTTLLKHLGCTATSHEEAQIFWPDELGARPIAERTDIARPRELVEMLRNTGRGGGLGRPRYVALAIAAGKEASASIPRAVCEVAAQMADRLDLGPAVRQALYENQERWDGKGGPQGLQAEDIALPSRIAELATQAVIFHRLGGPEAAREMVRRRSGGWFDPAVAEAFRTIGPEVLERLDRDDPWTAVLEAEPEPVREIAADRLEAVAEAFGDMVDLKTPFTLGHSSGVAELATVAAERMGISDTRTMRVAGLLHDLGRTAVGAGVWEKPKALSMTEWEQVRLHPYHTERILARSTALERLAKIAGMHHERQDGSGYHRGASAAQVPVESRVLAVADAYQAMTQDRAHRSALTPGAAAGILTAEVKNGRFDPDVARAVLDASGQRPARVRRAWPAGLSDREVEVLRLVTKGLSNRAIAQQLVISQRTAEHHVQHIYDKIGTSTRAAAAMFAMEHGLLRG
jgi:HD-GYP domain-containing protein (c-di-GMP phosphodiesterase class II)